MKWPQRPLWDEEPESLIVNELQGLQSFRAYFSSGQRVSIQRQLKCHFCPKPTWLPRLSADPLSLCLLIPVSQLLSHLPTATSLGTTPFPCHCHLYVSPCVQEQVRFIHHTAPPTRD